MTTLPVVSVLIPTYNHERFIARAIESALAQADHYPAHLLDIVLVDDGSTDATPRIVARYADRIRAIRKPNGGALTTVDRLLREARGEVCCFLAGDDAFRAGKVARQAAVMADRPWVSLVYGDAAIIDGGGAVKHPSYYGLHRHLPRPVGDVRGPLLRHQCICAPSIMMRTELRDRVLPFRPPVVWEDWWMFLHAAMVGEVLYVPGADVEYREHGANMSAGLDAAAQLRFGARELPFRRWLLSGIDHAGVPFRDMVAAFSEFERHLVRSLQAGLGEPYELLGLDADAAARAATERELAAATTDPAERVRRLVRALALDPFDAAARALLPEVVAAAERAQPPLRTRSAVVVALASELVRDPELLRAYVRLVDARDDVTLLIDARGWQLDRVEAELIPMAAAAGLQDDGPDALVDLDARPWPRERLVGVLTREPGVAAAFGGPQVTGEAELAGLIVTRPAA